VAPPPATLVGPLLPVIPPHVAQQTRASLSVTLPPISAQRDRIPSGGNTFLPVPRPRLRERSDPTSSIPQPLTLPVSLPVASSVVSQPSGRKGPGYKRKGAGA